VAAISLPFLAPTIVDGFEALLNLFGVGLALVVASVVANTRMALRRPEPTRTFARLWLGLHLAILFAFGIGGFFRPSWELGDVSFSEASVGGDLGRLMAASPIGIAAWVAVGLTGAGLIWPPGARMAGLAVVGGLRYVASLRIPQRIGDAIQSFFTALLPEPDEEHETSNEGPYVPELDEVWDEPSPEPGDEEPPVPTVATEEEVDAGDDEGGVLITSQAEDEPEAIQRPLPMGRPAGHGWELPPLDLLAEAEEVEVRPLDTQARAQLIVDTLASFGVDARVVAINQGPTVTQFGVEPGWEVKTRNVAVRDERGRPIYDKDGKPQVKSEVVSRTRVRVNKITNLANDLALALAAPTIRIEAPVPGKPIVGIQVPNTTSSLVALRSVIEGTAYQRVTAKSRLALALGKGVSGEPVAADLTKMPHLLIAGATGSGKSVAINSIIACLLLNNTPEQVRMVLVDPKRVELATFADIPHLAFSKVITEVEEIVGTLQGIIHEMDSRYRRFATIGVRNIEGHNKSPRASHKLPHWVVIVDELADLMMAAPYEVERQICRLAQLARATGIHLIIATQRPSVDVVTGLIKANFPTRIAFAVSSQVDSRTIIDSAGAEKLLGKGDMLFMPTDASQPRRLQGSYVSDQELDRIVAWWTNERFRHLRPEAMDHLLESSPGAERDEIAPNDEDPMYDAAKELAMQHSRVSTSLLQRRLHVGYPRAARLIDLLEREGVVAAAEGGQSREVLTQESAEPDDFQAFD
jgi:S-DNA-T family DNA segregation ATPase FtsK/SpoIIIE